MSSKQNSLKRPKRLTKMTTTLGTIDSLGQFGSMVANAGANESQSQLLVLDPQKIESRSKKRPGSRQSNQPVEAVTYAVNDDDQVNRPHEENDSVNKKELEGYIEKKRLRVTNEARIREEKERQK